MRIIAEVINGELVERRVSDQQEAIDAARVKVEQAENFEELKTATLEVLDAMVIEEPGPEA